MNLSIIVACSKNRVIGRDLQLPWRLPDDLQRFKALTLGHPVIMGRKTLDSIGRPLPGRQNIVITRQQGYCPEGVKVVHSLEQALSDCRSASEVFIIGGGEIYQLALPQVRRIYLTWVDVEIEGDAFFPDWSQENFVQVSEETHPVDEKHAFPFKFLILEKRASLLEPISS